MSLIDKDAVCKDCNRTHLGEGYCKFCSIYNMPTIDAVPVVRCKDCKFSYEVALGCGMWLYCDIDGCTRTAEYFCSVGKRREDAACDACDLTRWTDE